MDNTIPKPNPINNITKNKDSYDDISSDNTVTYTPTTSLLLFLSSYKETPGLHTDNTYIDFKSITGKIGTDQTGRFAVPYISGNNYLLILFDIERNSIFDKLIPNHTKNSNNNAYANTLNIIKNRELKP